MSVCEKRYKVVEVYNDDFKPDGLRYARELQEQFGLNHIDIETIDKMWTDYSDRFAAGWLIPDQESVEDVFKVKLEEIK